MYFSQLTFNLCKKFSDKIADYNYVPQSHRVTFLLRPYYALLKWGGRSWKNLSEVGTERG